MDQVIAAVIIFVCFVLGAGFYAMGIKVINFILDKNTPSCSHCVHCTIKDYSIKHNDLIFRCRRPEVLEEWERKQVVSVVNVRADQVRGTKFCKFEQKPEESSNGDTDIS